MTQFIVYHNPDFPWRDLTAAQRVDLDTGATMDRFYRTIRNRIETYQNIGEIVFIPDAEVKTVVFSGDSPWLAEQRLVEGFHRLVENLEINLEWLTYTSPDAHVKALINSITQYTANHVVVLPILLRDLYDGITLKEADALVAKAKDPAYWSKQRFVLG